jgi:RimJ/RimL family protein N-acetyltransferase
VKTTPPLGVTMIRRLWLHEREAFIAHLCRLDPASRLSRFGVVMDDAALKAYATRTFGIGSLVYACVIDGVVRGAAELHGLFDLPRDHAEAAFSIEEPWRGRGLGGALLDCLLSAARNRGFRGLEIVCAPDNFAMLALARKGGLTIERCADLARGRVRISGPSPASIASEAMRNGLAMLAARPFARLWRGRSAAAANPDGRPARRSKGD